jgi:solute carrier family 35
VAVTYISSLSFIFCGWGAVQVAVTYIPAPSFILFCQLASCAAFVKGMAVAGVVEAEPLEYEKAKKFALIVFGFIGTLFSNVTALRVGAPPS